MKWIKKRDIYLVVGVLIIAAFVYGGYRIYVSNIPAKAEIYYGSELVKTVMLNTGTDERFTVPEDEDVVFHLYADGSICFEESDCPDHICINSGRLHTVGQSAACLPNKLILKIVPMNEHTKDDVDMIG